MSQGLRRGSSPFPAVPSGAPRRSLLSALPRISRLFSDAKKILLYSQKSEKLDAFKETFQALQLLQSSRTGGEVLLA